MRSFLLTTLLLLPFTSHSALVGRLAATEGGTDYQAYYDTNANLTWLADANAAGTAMNWVDANTWASNLNIDSVTGWRLPDTLQSDASCDYLEGEKSYGHCTGSEMGNMFYNVLGNTEDSLTSTDPFSNVLFNLYWSTTELASSSGGAWFFHMGLGSQGTTGTLNLGYAWAVHDGDVASISSVPIPPSLFLFGSGLIGLIGFARKK